MKRKRILLAGGAGLLGTLFMTLLMLVGVNSGMAPMPEPIPRAIVGSLLPLSGAPLMLVAMISHFVYGAVWAILADQTFPDFDWIRGIMLGAFLWIIMQLVVLPLIGWGFFGINHTPAIAVATLILHLIYGATTGLIIQKWVSTANKANSAV